MKIMKILKKISNIFWEVIKFLFIPNRFLIVTSESKESGIVNTTIISNDTKEKKYTSPSKFIKTLNPLPIPNIKTSKEIVDNNPTILLMDDFSSFVSVVLDDFDYLNPELIKEANVLFADSNMAAFSVKKFLDDYEAGIYENIDHFENNKLLKFETEQHKIVHIDLALLDITIGGYNYINGEMKEYDGIDIAYFIKNVFPDCKIYFITGHAPNKKNPKIFKYMEKFKNYFNEEIDEYIIPKNGSRITYFEQDLKNIMEKYNKNIILNNDHNN